MLYATGDLRVVFTWCGQRVALVGVVNRHHVAPKAGDCGECFQPG